MGDAYFRAYLLIPTPHRQPASTTIEIASDFPTSGVDIISGLPLQNGVQMAITEANNKHLLPGYTLQLVPYNDVGSDNRHDPQVGANNLKLAIADNLVAGVIGPYNSSVAFKELPIVNQAPLALLSPDAAFSCLTKSTTDDLNCTSTNDIAIQMRPTGQLTFFRLVTTTDRQGKASADYFFQTKHYSKVLLLRDESDPYSSGLALAFQKEWQRIGGPPIIAVDLRQSTSGVQDYQNILQGAASFQPDLIYFSGGLPNGSDILQALFSIAALKTVPFAGGGAIMKDSFLRKVAYLHRDAPVYISMASEDPAHSGTNTEANFETKYNTANGYQDYIPDAATAYDCTMMLIQAIKIALQKGVSTPHGVQDHAGAVKFRQAVLQALQHLSYKGATGTHSFDANGDTTNHTISFYQADLSTPQPSWTWLQSINS
jgi:branched-chain amino acid transport system substrate-binding protein